MIAVTSFVEEARIRAALEAGATGYLLKGADAADVVDAIRGAVAGEIRLDSAVAAAQAKSLRTPTSSAASLTPRELEVVTLVAEGRTNREIGRRLGVAERTARTHVSNILTKLGLAIADPGSDVGGSWGPGRPGGSDRMSMPFGDSGQVRPSPLRSTSMPTEPELEPLAASWEPIERQMVDLFFDRVPFGLAVFDLEGRLQRCNRTWTGFYELYFGAGPDYTAPGRHLNDLIPGNEDAIAELFAAVRSGQVVRQAAHRIAIPGVATYWDVVFAPLFEQGELVGMLDVITDATDRVLSTERLEARIRAFTSVSSAMTVDQPLVSTLATVREQVMLTTAAPPCARS